MALNVCALTGTLVRDPATRVEDSGTPRTICTVRCDEVSRDGLTHPLFVAVCCYGKVAEQAATLTAGDQLAIEGKLMYRKYVTRTGETKSGLAVLAPAPAKVAHTGGEERVWTSNA